MNAKRVRLLAGVLAVGLAVVAGATAEVNVSLTITGNVDEIMAIVQALKNMGYGGGFDASDPLKLRVQSTHNVQPESAVQTPADAQTPPAESAPAAAPQPEPEPKPRHRAQ